MDERTDETCCLCGGPIDGAPSEPLVARVEREDGLTEEWRWHTRCFAEGGSDFASETP
jgi:hypothetical protein